MPDLEQIKKLYSIVPRNVFEASCGKATLLTDAMIAQLLDCLQFAQAQTEGGCEALEALWQKLIALWLEDIDGPVEEIAPEQQLMNDE